MTRSEIPESGSGRGLSSHCTTPFPVTYARLQSTHGDQAKYRPSLVGFPFTGGMDWTFFQP